MVNIWNVQETWNNTIAICWPFTPANENTNLSLKWINRSPQILTTGLAFCRITHTHTLAIFHPSICRIDWIFAYMQKCATMCNKIHARCHKTHIRHRSQFYRHAHRMNEWIFRTDRKVEMHLEMISWSIWWKSEWNMRIFNGVQMRIWLLYANQRVFHEWECIWAEKNTRLSETMRRQSKPAYSRVEEQWFHNIIL